MQILNTSKELEVKSETEIKKIKNETLPNSSCINKKLIQIIILIVLILLFVVLLIIVIRILNKPDIECTDGYFLEKNDKKCTKCSITNCKKCEGSSMNNTCITCFSSYIAKLINDTIISCELDEQKEINDSIIKYSDVYDVLSTDLLKTNFNQRINSYETNKEISSDIIDLSTNFKEKNEIFISDTETISAEEITINEVICEPGFFRDPESNTCHECSVHNCEICTGNINNDLCTSCFERFFPTYKDNHIISCDYCELGNKDKCLECDNNNFMCSRCNDGFQLSNGQCISEYSFEAIYKTNSYNQNIGLINIESLGYVNEMVIDGENISPTSNIAISNPGNHTVYFKMRNNIYSFTKMFINITNLISIYFYSNFNTENITRMESMFKNCISLTSIHLSKFNTSHVREMYEMFSYCTSLESLDLSNFNTLYVEDMDEMFFNCHSLTSLNLSSFNTNNVHSMVSMFSNCTSLKYLDISHFNINYVNYFFCENIFSSINNNVTIYINSGFKNILRGRGEIDGLRFKIIN